MIASVRQTSWRGYLAATRARFAASAGPIFILHDTTEFSYQRTDIDAVGKIGTGAVITGCDRRVHEFTQCGMLMHASLAVTSDGVPLGLAAVKFWTRQKFKGTQALKRHINPTHVPIEQNEGVRWLESIQQSTALLGEPDRCVHIGDRESDIHEFFCEAHAVGAHFLIRTCVDVTLAMVRTRLPPK